MVEWLPNLTVHPLSFTIFTIYDQPQLQSSGQESTWGHRWGLLRHPYNANLPSYPVKADNKEFAIIMKVYHHEKILGNQKILERLFADHGIKMRYDLICHLWKYLKPA